MFTFSAATYEFEVNQVIYPEVQSTTSRLFLRRATVRGLRLNKTQ